MEKIIPTITTGLIKNVCDYAQSNAKVIALLGEPGNGKTSGLNYAINDADDYRRLMVTVGRSFKPIHLYKEILLKMKPRAHVELLGMHELIREIAKIINKSEKNYLIAIDEGGKLTSKCLEYFHELFTMTTGKAGFIFSAPPYFRRNIDKWIRDDRQGMSEFRRRVNDWLEIDCPTPGEMATFCYGQGLTDESLIEQLVEDCGNFSELLNKIENRRIEAIARKQNPMLKAV